MIPTEQQAEDRARLRAEGSIALTKELIDRFGLLARKEVELAREELKLDGRKAAVAGTLGAVAVVSGVSALSCGLIAAIIALGRVIAPAVAALIGCGLFVVSCVVFLLLALSHAREAQPKRTIREAKATLGLLERLRHPGAHGLGSLEVQK